MNNLSFFFVCTLLVFSISCSEKSERHFPDKKPNDNTSGIEGLNGTKEVLFEKLKSLLKESASTEDILDPVGGEKFIYQVELDKFIEQDFKLDGKSCSFEYSDLIIEETILIEDEVAYVTRKFMPQNENYIGIPSEDLSVFCNENSDELDTLRKPVFIDKIKPIINFRKMVREGFLNLIPLCEKGLKLFNMGKCQGLDILELKDKSDGSDKEVLNYFFKGSLKAIGKEYPIEFVFSLRRVYWGFGGVILWNSPTPLFSKELNLNILSFQSLKWPRVGIEAEL